MLAYHNEESVGSAIKDSGLARKDIYVTTKYSGPLAFETDEKKRFDVRKDIRGAIETSLKKVTSLARVRSTRFTHMHLYIAGPDIRRSISYSRPKASEQ